MPIDWFTVVAQLVNFLILVWLLKRFLYKPILRAIDEREKGIASQLAEAEAKKTEAQKERDDFQHKNGAFDQERAALLAKATDEANVERARLLDEVRKEADSLRVKHQESLRNEQRNLNQEINRWAQKEVFAISRKALTDLAATSLEERMAEVFVQRLRALAGPAKERLATALKAATQPARVRSAFDLPATQRHAIETAVKDAFAAENPIQFETAPELVSGIELVTNGQKVAWSIAEYLATLEKNAGELLHQNTEAEPKPDASPKSVATPEPKVTAKPVPIREPKNGVKPVVWAAKADH
jgi:F-type H+-transporting ATPase subunit b